MHTKRLARFSRPGHKVTRYRFTTGAEKKTSRLGVLPLNYRLPLPAGLHRAARRRARRHGDQLRRARPALLRLPRHHAAAPADRQRLRLHPQPPPARTRSPIRHPAPPYSYPHPQTQLQSRALPAYPRPRMRLRAALRYSASCPNPARRLRRSDEGRLSCGAAHDPGGPDVSVHDAGLRRGGRRGRAGRARADAADAGGAAPEPEGGGAAGPRPAPAVDGERDVGPRARRRDRDHRRPVRGDQGGPGRLLHPRVRRSRRGAQAGGAAADGGLGDDRGAPGRVARGVAEGGAARPAPTCPTRRFKT